MPASSRPRSLLENARSTVDRTAHGEIDEIDYQNASEGRKEKRPRHLCEPKSISDFVGRGWLNTRDLKEKTTNQKNENRSEDQGKKHSNNTNNKQSCFGDSQNDYHFLYISQ